MRLRERTGKMAGLAAAAVLTLSIAACSDSNSVAAPSAPAAAAGANVAGSWTGSFQSYATTCSGTAVTATLRQNGAAVTGAVVAEPCGIRGTFRGNVSGNTLSGRLEMPGCSGGAVLGTASASGLSMTIGDFQRPVVSGDAIVIPGGSTSLHR